MLQRNRNATSIKPEKPFADFPSSARYEAWAKKIRGKLHYFGHWDDPHAAHQKYLDDKEDLHAGRTPRGRQSGVTVRDIVNRFLTVKQQLVDSGELAPRTFRAYHDTAGRITAAFGLRRVVVDLATEDFEAYRAGIAKVWGPVALGNEVNRVRIIFKFAFDVRLINAPVAFGPAFKRPSRKVLRQARQAKGPHMFEAAQLRRILGKAGQPLEAMILLGINCGFGNGDVSRLPIAALDLRAGWVKYPRHKTAIDRRAALWPETVKAIKIWMTKRPKPKHAEHESHLFITKRGLSWAKENSDNPVSTEFAKLLKELKLNRPGLNFYAIRHTFETVGGDTADQVAVDAIMGHAPASNDMASVYRERITDERLKAVAEHVRQWLWPPKQKSKAGTAMVKAKPKSKRPAGKSGVVSAKRATINRRKVSAK